MSWAKDILLDDAIRSADRLHQDRSVNSRKTIKRLEALREHIDILVEAVKCDLPPPEKDEE